MRAVLWFLRGRTPRLWVLGEGSWHRGPSSPSSHVPGRGCPQDSRSTTKAEGLRCEMPTTAPSALLIPLTRSPVPTPQGQTIWWLLWFRSAKTSARAQRLTFDLQVAVSTHQGCGAGLSEQPRAKSQEPTPPPVSQGQWTQQHPPRPRASVLGRTTPSTCNHPEEESPHQAAGALWDHSRGLPLGTGVLQEPSRSGKTGNAPGLSRGGHGQENLCCCHPRIYSNLISGTPVTSMGGGVWDRVRAGVPSDVPPQEPGRQRASRDCSPMCPHICPPAGLCRV